VEGSPRKSPSGGCQRWYWKTCLAICGNVCVWGEGGGRGGGDLRKRGSMGKSDLSERAWVAEATDPTIEHTVPGFGTFREGSREGISARVS
jgi:hypothetical protein